MIAQISYKTTKETAEISERIVQVPLELVRFSLTMKSCIFMAYVPIRSGRTTRSQKAAQVTPIKIFLTK
jgi:hypothetical protein